jgi:peptidoglycan hydrolase-like protein with peptidoglycan-binding domain
MATPAACRRSWQARLAPQSTGGRGDRSSDEQLIAPSLRATVDGTGGPAAGGRPVAVAPIDTSVAGQHDASMPPRPLVALVGPLLIASVIAGCGGGDTTTTTVTVTATSAAPPASSTTAEQAAAAAAAVLELQQVMTTLGYYSGPIDGIYGDATTAAVKTMQTALGITADGIYGTETNAALGEKGKGIVTALQTTLATYGYYSGPIDGDYGDATTAAVKKLQGDLGVTVDGRVGPDTVTAFNEAVANGTIKPA